MAATPLQGAPGGVGYDLLVKGGTVVSPDGVRGFAFLDEASTANLYAARLQQQGVNAIVLLIHQGGRQTGAEAHDLRLARRRRQRSQNQINSGGQLDRDQTRLVFLHGASHRQHIARLDV